MTKVKTATEMIEAIASEPTPEQVARTLERDEYYTRAFAALSATDRKAQRPGLVMAAIYQALLAEIRSDGMQVLTQRTALTPLRKLWIAWRTWHRN